MVLSMKNVSFFSEKTKTYFYYESSKFWLTFDNWNADVAVHRYGQYPHASNPMGDCSTPVTGSVLNCSVSVSKWCTALIAWKCSLCQKSPRHTGYQSVSRVPICHRGQPLAWNPKLTVTVWNAAWQPSTGIAESALVGSCHNVGHSTATR
jgi:hypothetical protein